jgi:hypothetical protein
MLQLSRLCPVKPCKIVLSIVLWTLRWRHIAFRDILAAHCDLRNVIAVAKALGWRSGIQGKGIALVITAWLTKVDKAVFVLVDTGELQSGRNRHGQRGASTGNVDISTHVIATLGIFIPKDCARWYQRKGTIGLAQRSNHAGTRQGFPTVQSDIPANQRQIAPN